MEVDGDRLVARRAFHSNRDGLSPYVLRVRFVFDFPVRQVRIN